jgi:hypothetical protein
MPKAQRAIIMDRLVARLDCSQSGQFRPDCQIRGAPGIDLRG